MTFVTQGVSVRDLAGNSEAMGSWSGTENPRWVRTLSHLGAAICITASTSVPARSFTTRVRARSCAEDRWKKFLSLISRADSASWVRSEALSDFDVREVICRARSRVGEDRYRLLTNNCEHFCEWCLHGTARSFQVEAWLARPRLTLLATLRLVIRVPMPSLLR